MKQFRYYITDLFDGKIVGTDDICVAINSSSCEDYFVVDTHTNEWLLSDGTREQIQEM
jgi:hypothetical protein